MAYIGGGAQGPIDWPARDTQWQINQDIAALKRQVADQQTRIDQLEAKLASTTEALDTVAGAA